MVPLFLKLFNMSLAASWLIIAVIVLRLVLKHAPKWIHCVLWALVAIRLLCPISIESTLSLIPSNETLRPVVVQYSQHPTINSGVTIIDNAVNPVIGEAFATLPTSTITPLYAWTYIVSIIWIIGVAVLLAYAATSYFRLRRVVRESAPLWDNIYLCDHIQTPFILGVVRPRVYLPSDLSDAQMQSVVAHEQAHLTRRDHWWKPLGWALLTVYWFNPLCWAAYILLCRDIELACDEKVIRDMDVDDRKAYSQALLSCSIPRRLVSACPLAFGEVGVKERIKGVLNYKKPAFWVIVVAVIACIVAAVCFLTNPKATGQFASVEEFAQAVMDHAKTVSYYNTEGNKITSNVTATKIAWLTKKGEVGDLAPNGTLEAWDFNYLVQIDADPNQVHLVGGMYEENGWFDLEGQGGHNIVSLRYADGSYDILYNAIVGDNVYFYGHHDNYEEAIYDWYVKKNRLDNSKYPLYIVDFGEQLTDSTHKYYGEIIAHRYDGDGWYVYIPISAWNQEWPDTVWTSLYNTDSKLSVKWLSNEELGKPEMVYPKHVQHNTYMYEAPNNGFFRLEYTYDDTKVPENEHTQVEPQVLKLMAQSFTVDDRFHSALTQNARRNYSEMRANYIFKTFGMNPVDYIFAHDYDLLKLLEMDDYLFVRKSMGIQPGTTAPTFFVSGDTIYAVCQDDTALNHMYHFCKEKDGTWLLQDTQQLQDTDRYPSIDEVMAGTAHVDTNSDAFELTDTSITVENLFAAVDATSDKEDVAKQLICNAFAFSIPDDIVPALDINEHQSTIQYTIEPGNVYLVEFKETFEFPATVYHFNHPEQGEKIDLAHDASYQFNHELVTIAQSYASSLYGVDCSHAEIHAYGYKDKIAVQLKAAADQIFHVRFYYNETTPTGIIFHNDINAFERFLDVNHAKQYL